MNGRVPAGLVKHEPEVVIEVEPDEAALAPFELERMALDRSPGKVVELRQQIETRAGGGVPRRDLGAARAPPRPRRRRAERPRDAVAHVHRLGPRPRRASSQMSSWTRNALCEELDRNRGRERVLVAAAVGPAARETERRADALPGRSGSRRQVVQLATQPVLTQVVQQRLAGAAAVGGQRGLDKLGGRPWPWPCHASRGRSTRVIAWARRRPPPRARSPPTRRRGRRQPRRDLLAPRTERRSPPGSRPAGAFVGDLDCDDDPRPRPGPTRGMYGSSSSSSSPRRRRSALSRRADWSPRT